MADRLRIGVVGLGWVGTTRHIPVIARNPQFELVGIADRSSSRLEALASRYRVRGSTADSLAEIDWIEEVDAVSIATAPMAHHDLACEAIERGLHVITEKPFAMTVAEGRAMVAAAAGANRRLAVVHNFQFARSMRRLRRDLESSRLGQIRGLRAIQLGNPSRRLPDWYEELPLGLFYDESPHLLYLLSSIAGPLSLVKAVSAENRRGGATPTLIDAWFATQGDDYPISLSCNFESSVSEWYLVIHGEHAMAVVDIFRDIYMRLPNDGRHGTTDVIRTSLAATGQHWWQHLTSGVPHLAGKLRYGNDEVFARFARAIAGERGALGSIDGSVAQRILTLQHAIISERERLYA